MDKVKILRSVVKKIYPDASFVVRVNKLGKFQIILKGAKTTYYEVETFERKLVLKNDKVIVMDNFQPNLEAFYPFFTKENCDIKYILWNGKVKNWYGNN
jgi:predicted transcriptional regulator